MPTCSKKTFVIEIFLKISITIYAKFKLILLYGLGSIKLLK